VADKDKRLADLAQAVEGATNIVPIAGRDGEPPGPDPGSAGGGQGRGRGEAWVLRADGLPDGCPIIPLGKHGHDYFYLDALRQIVSLRPRDHGRNALASLFAPSSELCATFWPRWKEVPIEDETGAVVKGADGKAVKQWVVSGFAADHCADALMDACARRGVWNAFDQIRGAGAWLGSDGRLILHCGDTLWRDGETIAPGTLDGFVYPSAPRLPRPAQLRQPTGADGGPGGVLLDTLKTWAWERGHVDAMLLLGWAGAAMLGGALDWRPMAFITGDTGSGKSTLHKLFKYLFDGGMVQSSNTTAAGLYQEIKQASVPIAIDELEAGEDNRRAMQVLELARQASSGSVMLRGGAEHQGVQFTARSCFLFSAILPPPFAPQDRSRMAILRLKSLPEGQVPPAIEPAHWAGVGRGLLRRLADQWPRLADTLHLYRATLSAAGHDARGCDQFGTLLACADLLLFDQVPDADTLDEWRRLLDAATWRELTDTASDAESCLDYLAESCPEAWRGGSKQSVAELVREQCRGLGETFHAVALSAGGLGVVRAKGERQYYLAVGNAHRGTMHLFEGSRWAGKAGMTGGWVEALARVPGAVLGRTARIGGRPTRCVQIPVEAICPDLGPAGEARASGDNQSAGPADAASSSDLPY